MRARVSCCQNGSEEGGLVLTGRQSKNSLSVIAAYGELMERYPTAILDEAMLPLSKHEMKLLLKTAWMTETDATQRNALEIAFVGLSNFRIGVGGKPIDCQLPSAADPAATLEILTPWLMHSTLVSSEATALLAELSELKKRATAIK